MIRILASRTGARVEYFHVGGVRPPPLLFPRWRQPLLCQKQGMDAHAAGVPVGYSREGRRQRRAGVTGASLFRGVAAWVSGRVAEAK